MGVEGLWKILESERALRSYAEVFVKEGYTDGRLHRVGIDAEGIMHAAQAVFNKRGHVQHGMNPELWAILCLLCRFACQPAMFIFVFDGPHKVKTKRGKRVMSQPIWLIDYFKLLIKNFGFHHRDAIGEAEVELCHLQKRGALDIIFSEDSDVWVYGATRVIRRLPTSMGLRQLAEYTASHIYETSGLSQAGFLLFALVSGGDYDEGVAGVGPTIAHALARGPLANRLWQLILKGRAYYKANIKAWRSDLVDELVHNRSGFLRKRERAVAAKLPKDFPRLDLVWQYAYPASSIDDEARYLFEPQKLDLDAILLSCQAWFGLSTYSIMYKRCIPLAKAHYFYSLFDMGPTAEGHHSIAVTKIKKSADSFYVRVEAKPYAFTRGVHELTKAHDYEAPPMVTSVHFDLPLPIAEARLRHLVRQFYTTPAGKRHLRSCDRAAEFTNPVPYTPPPPTGCAESSPDNNLQAEAGNSIEIIDLTEDIAGNVYDPDHARGWYIEISDQE